MSKFYDAPVLTMVALADVMCLSGENDIGQDDCFENGK